MVKVLISGYYGFHNLGDEAILTSLIDELNTAAKGEVEITVLTNTPKETAEQFGIKTVKRDALFQVIGAMRKTDILLNGGGSLLQDNTSNRSIYYYLAVMKLARLFGKRVASISCGIGPIHSRFNRWLVRRAVDQSFFTTVRDPDSYDLLRQLGADMTRVSVTSDLVLGLPIQNADAGDAILEASGISKAQRSEKPVLAMAMRAKDFTRPEMLERLEKLILMLSETYTVVFLPFFYKADMKLKDLLARGTHAEALRGRYTFLGVKCSAEEYMSLLANCAVLVGTRLHAMIFSLMAGTPFVGVSYDPKVDSFLGLVGLKPISQIAEFSETQIAEAVAKIGSSLEQQRGEVAKQREKLRKSMGINALWLESLVSSNTLPPIRTGREAEATLDEVSDKANE